MGEAAPHLAPLLPEGPHIGSFSFYMTEEGGR
jgi:hypothetical protein